MWTEDKFEMGTGSKLVLEARDANPGGGGGTSTKIEELIDYSCEKRD